MEKTERFYKCEKCGNIVGLIEDAGVPLYCCQEKMQPMYAKADTQCSGKKLPKVTVNDNQVTVYVGQCTHSMDDNKHIGWIYLETNQGGHRKSLCQNNRPAICFELSSKEQPYKLFAYCNKHGLWETDLSNFS